jgi:hypothetical protein
MRAGAPSLLCELHAHTTWSDGDLSLEKLVDLYGSAGFDVLCVTTTRIPQAIPGRTSVFVPNSYRPTSSKCRSRPSELGRTTVCC